MNMCSQPDCYEKIIRFMEERNASVSPLKTREIADAAGLTRYQTREYLAVLQSSGVVEKVNFGKGGAGQWRLL